MVANLVVGLFLEDSAQERFISALADRIASEMGIRATFDILNASGGIPRMRRELRRFLRQSAQMRRIPPNILIVVQDTDCRGEATIKIELSTIIQRSDYSPITVIAAPEPHIECWYLADPAAIQMVNRSPSLVAVPSGECEKDLYKTLLINEFPDDPLGGLGKSEDIISAMNLYRAGRNVPSLGNFINELRSALNQFA